MAYYLKDPLALKRPNGLRSAWSNKRWAISSFFFFLKQFCMSRLWQQKLYPQRIAVIKSSSYFIVFKPASSMRWSLLFLKHLSEEKEETSKIRSWPEIQNKLFIWKTKITQAQVMLMDFNGVFLFQQRESGLERIYGLTLYR